MNKLISIILISGILLISSGCASPTVVKAVKPADNNLTCAQLINELSDMDNFIEEANEVKGVTGGNVARALIFPLAIIGSYSNANEAIAAAETRKVHLSSIMREKDCPSG